MVWLVYGLLLFNNQIVEVPPWKAKLVLKQWCSLQVRCKFVNQLPAKVKKAQPGHFLVPVRYVCWRIRKTCDFQQFQDLLLVIRTCDAWLLGRDNFCTFDVRQGLLPGQLYFLAVIQILTLSFNLHIHILNEHSHSRSQRIVVCRWRCKLLL